MTEKIKEKFEVRLNPRFTKTQAAKIKNEAKKLGIGEGEMFRKVVDYYFSKNK